MSDHGTSRPGPRWPRRTVLSLAGAAGAGGLAGGLAGCGGDDSGDSEEIKKKIDNPGDNVNRKGFPIVDDPVKLHFMTGRWPKNLSDYNKVANWKKYRKKTNIEIDWGLVPFDSREEKRNLALSGDDYPEAFHTMNFTTRDVGKYGSQGQFIKLNDLIDKYMPNLKKLMDDNKEVRNGMTFPDEGIYGMPTIHDPDFPALLMSSCMYVRADWLDKFDMDPPKTIDEYHRYLKQVKNKKPNGKSDAIPYCDDSEDASRLRNALAGSFGIANRGTGQAYIDADPDDEDKVRFYRTTDEYKALLEYLHRLYSEGLIAKNIFSLDAAKFQQAAAGGKYGSMVVQSPSGRYSADHFTPIGVLKGPTGERSWTLRDSVLTSVGGFVITDKCKHPVETARWMDYFYSDEGVKLFFMGVKGKSYQETDEGVEYIDEIRNPKKGTTTNEAKAPYVTYLGGGYAGWVKEEYFKGVESNSESKKAAKMVEPYAHTEIWPEFTNTRDEGEKLDSLAEDIEKYVDESEDKFVTGDLKLSDWDKYVEKINQMGLDEYMEIQQAACDRYRKN